MEAASMDSYDRRSFLTTSAALTIAFAGDRVLKPLVSSRQESAIRRGLDHPFFAHARKPDVIAHRGGNGQWPGETMYAMRRARQIGVDVLEMDVYMTKDHDLVLMHDIRLRKTTEGSGFVFERTLTEIRELHANYHWAPDCGKNTSKQSIKAIGEEQRDVAVPALLDVLNAFPEMRMVIEMKPAPKRFSPVVRLIELIRETWMKDNVLVASFDASFMKNFRQSFPEVATSLTLSIEDAKKLVAGRSQRFRAEVLNQKITEAGPDAVQLPHWAITKWVVDAVRHHGLALHAWTVNRISSMERMLSLGVDGIITDCP
jgi:glycerophosphoryl diester phosphodiesterase